VISISMSGVREGEAQLRKFARMLDRPIINALRRGLTRVATATKNEIRTRSGIGRSIWAKKASTLSKQVYRMKVTKRGEDLETGIKLKGIPALIEEGGRIAAHSIRPKSRPFLAFQASGRWIFTRKPVQHPGSMVHRHGFAKAAMDREAPAIVEEMNRQIGVLKEESFG
jgi:hypothetical protein